MRECTSCGGSFGPDGFHKDKSGPNGLSHYCRSCNKARAKAWRDANLDRAKERDRAYNAANRDKIRDANLRYKFGVGSDEYDRILESQGGACGICGRLDEPIRGRAMPLDHDHVSGAPRGVLCSSCNRAIGLLGDDPDVLMKAAAYLWQFQSAIHTSASQ